MPNGKFKKGDPKPPSSGKKKGSKHKLTQVKEACESAGFSPAEFLIALARADKDDKKALGIRGKVSLKDRREAAEALLDRLDPKLKQVEIKGDAENPVQFIVRGPKPIDDNKEWEQKWSQPQDKK